MSSMCHLSAVALVDSQPDDQSSGQEEDVEYEQSDCCDAVCLELAEVSIEGRHI